MPVVKRRRTCRLCGSDKLYDIWSFGKTPLANAYLAPEAVKKKELFVPLDVTRCEGCFLVQLRHVVDPKVLFQNYFYVSSTSASFVQHFEDYAARIAKRFKLGGDDLVVDVGSNDGVLLKPFQKAGMRVLGIEPAKNIAKLATAAGINTVSEFFTPLLTQKLLKKYGPSKVITANNVFAHTDRVDVFANAARDLLTDDGVFVFEVQYLADLIKKNLFDIVYHEHLCYYHVAPLVKFFPTVGLEVFDVEHMPVHGGSIRVFVQKKKGPHKKTARLQKMLQAEKKQGLNTNKPYLDFAERISQNKEKLTAMLATLKKAGKRVVGYGAPAKATTLCYAFGLDATVLDYIVDDDTIMKQGKLMPGTHIPIVSPQKLYTDKPDVCLILAWNFAQPIMKTHAAFAGQFIVPVPTPKLI